jgi:electron transfer flavoprotein beta subunit
MKIVVCVKRVGVLVDDLEFVDDDRAVDADYLDYEPNEWDLYALEAALRLRDDGGEGEVVVVTVGDEEAEEVLVRCLAMGADRAVRIWTDDLAGADVLVLAAVLADVARRERPDLVLCGAQSADAAQAATGTGLAALLAFPCVAVVTSIELASNERMAVVHRELEGGLVEVCEVDLPAVLTIQTGIDEPRYVTLRAVQQAEDAEIELVEPDELAEPGFRVRRMLVPPSERAEMMDGASSVAAKIVELVRGAAA